jgi:hypothetical protein
MNDEMAVLEKKMGIGKVTGRKETYELLMGLYCEIYGKWVN